ncbi:uncharacterized protein LOC117554169 [Gymnodraco acuticeps]|uniref:Uncharacterized protein LOC117554169 n=1 Tax=Gymnodraco acuticeps TaxID=8218 RepID=A0A6P8V3U5_GYMAC|nr:uncharacterized protein LOC117554169 [Gymnodraco acuticeps]
MSRRRCFMRCERKLPLFGLPKEEELRKKWLQFIFISIPTQFNPNLSLCSQHFTDDCFMNHTQFVNGFSQRLHMKYGAVPTLFGDPGNPVPQPIIAPLARFHDVGCQTDAPQTMSVGTRVLILPKKVTVGTQLAWGTLKHRHVRSKGSQTTESSLRVDNETFSSHPDFHLPSTSIETPGLRPRKRPRLELEYDMEQEEEEEEEDVWDPTREVKREPKEAMYSPVGSVVTEGSETPPTYSDCKYIVFESCLKELFDTCPVCKRSCEVLRRRMGTFVAFTQLCQNCTYSRRWQSQPVVGSTPVGNLQISAATYFTGSCFSQLEKICKAMHLQIFPYDTFRKHARSFLEPAVVYKWKVDQHNLLQKLHQGGKVAVGGDMQTTGKKYGSYTLMHLESNRIVDLQLVQSNEVGGRIHMEKEGLKRCLNVLESNCLPVEYIVTDRRPQIQKFLSERNITQFYDVWHFEKDLSVKLKKLSQSKDCGVLKNWLRSIKNHVYWTAVSSTSGHEKVAKWTSLVNHVQNVHVHKDPIFPKCEHPVKVSRDESKYVKPGSIALNKLEKVLVNKTVVGDVEKLSHHNQTASLEAFHRLIQRFVPKNGVLPFMEMLCRLYLAVMHFNENANREVVYKVVILEDFKGECITKPVKTEPTHNYVDDLMRLVFDEVLEDPTPFVEELKTIPIPGERSSQQERPSNREEVPHNVSSQVMLGSQHTNLLVQQTPGVSGIQPWFIILNAPS